MTTVLLYQPEDTFELFSICWGRSFDDCFDFIGVGSNAIAAVNVSEIFDRRLYEHSYRVSASLPLDARFEKRVQEHAEDRRGLHP